MNKIKKQILGIYLIINLLLLLLSSCGKQCEQCDCWKGGIIIDNYTHCSGNFFPDDDHKFYRNYMIETYNLDSVSCYYN